MKQLRKQRFHHELHNTGCQSGMELKELKKRRQQRQNSVSRRIRHMRREAEVWIRAWGNMYSKQQVNSYYSNTCPLEAFEQCFHHEQLALLDDLEINYSAIRENILASVTDRNPETIEPVESVIDGRPKANLLYFMQPLKVPKRVYSHVDLAELSVKDPRNNVYYKEPPIDSRFMWILHYIFIPLNNAEEEWQRIQEELTAASAETL